jgi:DNA-binding NarL/FixJ family response regulator
MIRVLIADDQPLIRIGLRGIIDGEEDMEVVAEAVTGSAAVAAARTSRADVVLMDVRMPGLDGIEATRLMRADPELAHVRVLVLTTFETDDYVDGALHAGADGFLGKGAEPRELVEAVRVVAGGGSSLSSRAARGLIDRFRAGTVTPLDDDSATLDLLGRLTSRELEVLRLVASGASNDEIATRLVISPLTVKTHVNRAMTKVGAHDRAQLVILAYEGGLLPRQ